jgi:predicted ATPase
MSRSLFSAVDQLAKCGRSPCGRLFYHPPRQACESAGQIKETSTLLDDALQIVERTGERWFAAELNRNKGQLLLRQGHSEAAEELYRKALSIASEQGAKLWELRAAVSLARLRRDQGRHSKARDLLVPVYGWFTEGFDMPDLKEAKALLDELVVGHRKALAIAVNGSRTRRRWSKLREWLAL